jgi:hypothetical protein
MRSRLFGPLVTLVAALALSSVAAAQTPTGDAAGPAPQRDLNGVWTVEGYGLGTSNRSARHQFPPLTPLGEERMKQNKPEPVVGLAKSNDPYGTCDPLGFPRDILNQQAFNASMRFIESPDRMFILYQFQKVWREIWKDGRELPKEVNDAGTPDARYYGFSVGRWDGDYTFVIESTGTDDRTWLDNEGHPHSSDLRVVERYTRLDQSTMALTVTIDDPKIYMKPFDWITGAKLHKKVNPDFDEMLCIPSASIEYKNSLVLPTVVDDPAAAK